MKRILLCATLAALAHGAIADTLADSAATTRELRTLAREVKLALDHPGDKHAPQNVTAFHRRLDALAAAANAQDDSALAQKHNAVAHLIDKLAFMLAHPAATGSGAPLDAPARIDRETLSAKRGTSCTGALGVSTGLPVEVTLGDAGQPGADAWFRIEPAARGHLRFTTDSSGADPALAVYRACGGTALAQNDDTLGLDASVDVAVDDRAPLYVHVANGGSGGNVRLSVSAADATISGTITDAATGHALVSANLTFYTSTNNYTYSYTYTDNAGHYTATLPAGQYYVQASASQHVSELYPAAACGYSPYYYSVTNCDLASAILVTANSGATTPNVNIALGIGQRISGTVRSTTNDPVPNALVSVLDSNGNNLSSTYADTFGRYLITTVPNGSYVLRANGGNNYSGYGSQLYNQVNCTGPVLSNCDLTQATPAAIYNRDLIGADFTLQPLSSIHGTVYGSGGNYAYIYVLNAAGAVVVQGYAGYQGAYSIGPLPVGTYYAYVQTGGHFSQLYAGVNCDQNCNTSLNAATPIVIAQLGDSPQVDFSPNLLPQQGGHIQDAVTNQPLPGVTVYASAQPPSNYFYNTFSAVTNANGDYLLPGAGPGSYYVWAQSPDHIDEVYPNVVCEAPGYYYGNSQIGCDVSSAVLMTVTPSTVALPAMDFSLQPSSTISGNVSLRGLPSGASGTQVGLYNGTGAIEELVNVDTNGNYVISDLQQGTYYAEASSVYSNAIYVPQIWQGIDCPNSCFPTQGTAIAVPQNGSVGNIDFSLLRRDAIIGHVTDSLNQPLNGVLIDLFDAMTLTYLSTAATDAQGNYMAIGNLGSSYFVATEAPGHYINQIYAGVACPSGPAYQSQCAFGGATAVPLPYGATQPNVVNFVLALPPDEIFKAEFE